MTPAFTIKNLLELSEAMGEFTEIIISNHLEPWQQYIIDAYQDPVFPMIRSPRRLIIHKDVYDALVRYIKWRDAWLRSFWL